MRKQTAELNIDAFCRHGGYTTILPNFDQPFLCYLANFSIRDRTIVTIASPKLLSNDIKLLKYVALFGEAIDRQAGLILTGLKWS